MSGGPRWHTLPLRKEHTRKPTSRTPGTGRRGVWEPSGGGGASAGFHISRCAAQITAAVSLGLQVPTCKPELTSTSWSGSRMKHLLVSILQVPDHHSVFVAFLLPTLIADGAEEQPLTW